jgi:hypothetical protein
MSQATAKSAKLSSELRYLNERLKDGRATLQSGFSMKRLGKPDPAFQPRAIHLDMDHVKTLDEIYQVRGSLDPVVIVHVARRDRDILVDGFHRHQVYRNAKECSIPAYVIEGTLEDAMEYAAMANQHAILKRTGHDIQKQVWMLLAIPRWFQAPDAEISRHVGVCAPRVTKYRSLFCQDRGIPLPAHYRDIHGGRRRRRADPKNPSIYRSSSGLYGCKIGRRSVWLGRDLVEARQQIAHLVEQDECRKRELDSANIFNSWLPLRGIVLQSVGGNGGLIKTKWYPGMGRIACGYGRIVTIARLDQPPELQIAIGRLILARTILRRPDDRFVCLCYVADGTKQMVEAAREAGVELLTPEELVESIQADDGGGSPDPAPDPAPHHA